MNAVSLVRDFDSTVVAEAGLDDIVQRPGLQAWPRLFHNLRAS
jgi:hypothetical protein